MRYVPHAVSADRETLVKAGTVDPNRPDLAPVGTTETQLLESQQLTRRGVPKSYLDPRRLHDYVPAGLVRFRREPQRAVYPVREPVPAATPPKPKTKKG